jgi:hypothetical protein
MDWIKYVRNHPGSLHFQRIGRNKNYSAVSNENTLISWLRESQKTSINTNFFITVENIIVC